MKDHRAIGTAAESLYASYEHYFGKRDRPMHPTPLRSFHNALRILRSLDYHEVSFLTHDAQGWEKFRKDPYTFFITCSDAHALGIWRALQARQPPELREPEPSPTSKYEMKFNNTPNHANHDWLVLKDGVFIAGFASSNAAEHFIRSLENEI